MKKNKIFFWFFLVIWTILIILNFVTPKLTFSEQENRILARIPGYTFQKLISGEYAQQLDKTINDHFVFRNSWLKIKSWWEILLGKTENNGVYIGKDGYLFEKIQIDKEKINNIEKGSQVMENFANKVEVPVYVMIIPTSIYINQDKLPDYAQTINQEELIYNTYQKMKKAIPIDVTQAIKQNTKQQLYFKTDHHMTTKGAYVVYQEFCTRLDLRKTAFEEYTIKQVSNSFLGTFDSKAQMIGQKPDQIEIYENERNTNLEEVIYDDEVTNSLYNEEYLQTKDKYSYFLNGNQAKVVIKTKEKNGKKLLIIKDSYAHIMAPFFCQNYEEIHLLDPRYYKKEMSEYVEEIGITECLFLYNFSNLLTDVGIRTVR